MKSAKAALRDGAGAMGARAEPAMGKIWLAARPDPKSSAETHSTSGRR